MTFFLKMPKRYCIGLLLLFRSFTAFSQIDINGRVVDELDGSPLPNACLYFNNTTIGTTTDQQGFFHFEAVKLLNTALVISCPGYEVFAYQPIAELVEGKKIIFKLHAKEKTIQNSLELSEQVRKNWLNAFFQNFLGISEEASKCYIVNESAIHFTLGENKSSFSAFADSPIVLINTMLGYKISFNLENFSFDVATGKNYLFGYARFEELTDSKNWTNQQRKNCYYGSSLHFYRSLVSNQLFEQGFGTFLDKSKKQIEAASLKNNQRVTRNPVKVQMEPISAQQILHIDSTNNFSIHISDPLLVQYDKNPSAKNYLSQKGWVEGFLTKGVESYIRFNKSPIGINYAGVLSDGDDIEYVGYWQYEKLANRLPYNYSPD